MDDHRAADLIGQAEELLEQVESLPDPDARAAAVELLRALLALYGEGLARLTATAMRAGGDTVATELADDDLVAHLLLLHGLHPLDLPTRVGRAIETVRPRLGGANPEVVSLDGGTVRLSLPGAATGCRSSASAARTALEEAIRDAAPEIERVEVEQPRPAVAVIPVASLWQGAAGSRPRTPAVGG